MAKASAFTTTGTINPAEDMIPYMKWDGIKFVNRKVTAVNAGIQQPDYVAQAQATAARAQANEASDIADTALTTAWFGTSSGKSASDIATAALFTAWSGTAAALQAQSVSKAALTTSWVGTSTGHEAYDIARTALETSWVGTNSTEALAAAAAAYSLGRVALDTAWVGTSTGHEAYDIGRAALEMAWVGTSAAAAGGGGGDLTTAWAGTAAAREARAVAQTALVTSWTGTSLATSAHSVASSAYDVAVSGTVGSVTVGVSSGTAILNMAGQSFQTVNITGNTVIDMIGELPATPTKVQEITAILKNNDTPHSITCANFDWMTNPVTVIGANQDIFIGFVSFGSTVNQVSAAAVTEDTAAAHEAYDLAQSAYTLASAGTVSHSTLSASAGTVTFSMSGSAYQSAVIGGNTAIAVTDIQAPTSTYIQAITARIHNNNTGSNFTLFWDAFGILGSTPPGSVTNNHSVFASFTSYGTSVQNVFLATATHI